MTAGWCCRAVRAAVFAAVCTLLAALGHAMMSGSAVPGWAVAAAVVGVGGGAWCLAGRERGLVCVVAVATVAQTVLHSLFSVAQSVTRPEPSQSSQLSQISRMSQPSSRHPTAHQRPLDEGSLPPHMDHLGHLDHLGLSHMTHMGPEGGGSGGDGAAVMAEASSWSSSGMLAAHVLAGLLCSLWLAHGERAAFRLLRALAGWFAAPLRLPVAVPVPVPHRPRPRRCRDRSARTPRQFLLVHTITSRGPPAGPAVV